MNEDHVLAAILTSGLVSRGNGELQPKDVVKLYEATLAELLAVTRPPRGTPANPANPAPA
jgi:hypothetical protein